MKRALVTDQLQGSQPRACLCLIQTLECRNNDKDVRPTASAQNLEVIVIPDRIIEQGTLTTDGPRTAVEVRLPWYRALPGSCIAGAKLSIDGVEAPTESLRWSMNGREFGFPELVDETGEWWFPTDSAVLSGELPVAPGEEHEVRVDLTLYIPYIIISDTETLHIEEHDTKTMKAVAA